MDDLYLDTLGVGFANFGKLEVLDISPQDFEVETHDFNTNADEFGFDRQMNWNNSIESGQDSSPMSPESESSSTASTSSIEWKAKKKSKKAHKNRRRHRQFSSDSEGDFPAPKRTQNRRSPNIVHWLLQLLMNPETSDVLAWEDYNRGVFKIVSQERLGKLWGDKKRNPEMTYNNVARTMRYHYQSKGQELQVVSRKLVYKFSSQFLNANRTHLNRCPDTGFINYEIPDNEAKRATPLQKSSNLILSRPLSHRERLHSNYQCGWTSDD